MLFKQRASDFLIIFMIYFAHKLLVFASFYKRDIHDGRMLFSPIFPMNKLQ